MANHEDRRLKKNKRVSVRKLLGLGIPLVILLALVIVGVQIVRWDAQIWLPAYISGLFQAKETVPDAEKHVIFVMVDHYEPGYEARGEERNLTWLEEFRGIADRHHDSYGNRFRYTWFYPYDHKNQPVLRDLSRMPFEDYGEIDLHWHHPESTNEDFPGQLAEATTWFRKFGCFREYTPAGRTRFAFIHGSWALDDSREWESATGPRRCGVSLEPTFLQERGCYGDFTFPAFGNSAQPAKINSIYYAEDTPAPKSYNTGIDAEVGRPDQKGFLLVEGPLGFNTKALEFEYSGVEGYALPTPHRIQYWIDANIHVKGRPEWVFVKVFSHGQQFRDSILGKHLDPMLTDLERICEQKGYRLHYMTAREAVNLIKAAERGETGDPEQYRDYELGRRCDSFFHTEIPVTIERMSPEMVAFRPDTLADVRYEFKGGALTAVEGRLHELRFDAAAGTLQLDAEGTPKVYATEPLELTGTPAELIRRD